MVMQNFHEKLFPALPVTIGRCLKRLIGLCQVEECLKSDQLLLWMLRIEL